jgi:hypothetical protein
MLDSLVRVSRRVGWSTDRFATDPSQFPPGRRTGRPRAAVSAHCEQWRRKSIGRGSHPGPRGAAASSAPKRTCPPRPAVTLADERSPRVTFRAGAPGRPGAGRGPRPGESAPCDRRAGAAAWSDRIHRVPGADAVAAGLNSPGRTLRVHPFTSVRFHVLLNSPFKVLFNFPSRYLSAIGLVPVFSLRWSLPPTFGLHSQTTRLRGSSKGRTTGAPHGPDTLSGQGHDQEDLDARRRPNRLPVHHISRRPQAGGFGAGLFPLHSPLLGESSLVSFPPLTDMLKFSG